MLVIGMGLMGVLGCQRWMSRTSAHHPYWCRPFSRLPNDCATELATAVVVAGQTVLRLLKISVDVYLLSREIWRCACRRRHRRRRPTGLHGPIGRRAEADRMVALATSVGYFPALPSYDPNSIWELTCLSRPSALIVSSPA